MGGLGADREIQVYSGRALMFVFEYFLFVLSTNREKQETHRHRPRWVSTRTSTLPQVS